MSAKAPDTYGKRELKLQEIANRLPYAEALVPKLLALAITE